MRKTLVAQLALAGTIGLAAALAAGTAGAAPCASCHTMHNSQDGDPMRFDNLAEPLAKLLREDCIGCHTGDNAGLITESPKIMRSADPVYGTGTLAGGSFWYATQGNSLGHNVAELGASTDTLANLPPGWSGAGADLGGQLTCAGTLGCHGDRTEADTMTALQGAHHDPHNTVNDALGALTVGTSFRFLLGVEGREDTDWEYTTADANPSGNHNIYKGATRSGESEVNGTPDMSTISSLCAQCHGNFHREDTDGFGIVEGVAGTIGTNNWIRHPTDYDMPGTASGTEYQNYTIYKTEAPVGTETLGATIDVTAPGSRIVLCVSCHRAHGSPYADILRWDYTAMEVGTTVAGEAGTGCFNCHSAKDGI